MRNHIFRMAWFFEGMPEGSMLIVAPTIEMAISQGCKALKKNVEVTRAERIFWSPEEERDFMTYCLPKPEKVPA